MHGYIKETKQVSKYEQFWNIDHFGIPLSMFLKENESAAALFLKIF